MPDNKFSYERCKALWRFTASVLISIFSLFLFSFALEKYFDKKVTTVVNNSYELAKNYVREVKNRVEADIVLIALDTNKIISSISRQIKTTTKVGKAGNPLDFYLSIIKYLNDEPFRFEYNSKYHHNSTVSKKQPPHLIIYEYGDEESKNRIAKLQFKHKSGHTYRLENAILRDMSESHFACFLTCNKKDWVFDGFSYSRMERVNWKHGLLNDNMVFVFDNYSISDVMKFNFKQGYQILFYYRID